MDPILVHVKAVVPVRFSFRRAGQAGQTAGGFVDARAEGARVEGVRAERVRTERVRAQAVRAVSPRTKTLRMIGALSLTVVLTACAGGTGTTSQNGAGTGQDTTLGFNGQPVAADAPVVLTTFTVLADIAQNVAGEHLRVESLTKPGTEIHGYEPTPGDLRRAAQADLIFNNGLNLEVWFEQFMADVDAPRIVVSEGVETLDITGDAYAGKPNPHAWMSPLNVKIYADNMAQAFAELDPENAENFSANAEQYKSQLDQLHATLLDGLETLQQGQRALVTCEGAFSYLAKDAGLTEAYIWPVNAENQATPQQIAGTVNFVGDNQIPAVFCESTVANDPMMQVVDATNTQFGGVLYVDSLSLADGPVPTYLDLIEHDVNAIVAGLTGSQTGAKEQP